MLALAAAALLVWAAQFHHIAEFGLYEDDYWFVAQAMGKGPDYLLLRLQTAFTVLPQGRPLGFFLPDLLSFVGDKIGGLAAIYALGYAIVTFNTYLCYRFLRVRMPTAPAVFGSAVFCLFPVDTTRVLLTHDFQLQPSLTFALLAGLAYAGGRRLLAYALSGGALLSYESGFLALFALPLLLCCWDRRLPRALALNALALTVVMAFAVTARFAVGEVRATQSVGGVTDILPRLIGSLALGPLRSLAGMFYGPLKAVPTWDIETVLLAGVAAAGIALTMWALVARTRARVLPEHDPAAPRERMAPALRVACAGAVMLVLGYGLAFTHFPPNALIGRGTSVHLGATLGMAVLAAGVAWLLLPIRPTVAAVLLGAYVGLAVGYYVTIERDFIRAWQLQRSFWQQVVACCSDLQDGTLLIYELSATDEPTFIFANSWADPLVLAQTFVFPSNWTNPPRLFSLTEWLPRVQADGDHLRWWVPGASWDEHWETLPQDNVILLRRAPDGALSRVTGSIDAAGQRLRLKAPSAPGSWPPAPLHDPLLRP